MNYRDYVEAWGKGINSELFFWLNFITTEGGQSFYGFEKTISADRYFELEEDIPTDYYGKTYKFIDVGSGPFSRCGYVSNKVKLDAISVDPLAYAYNVIKQQNNVNNGINLITGFVELLDRIFEPNTFDMVHMSNALDHCFSTVDGIYQLLNICKIGGKVILRHHENEAENENYSGLHQWNLSLHNSENSFVVWRDNLRFDICKIFEEYADFELYSDIREKGGYWIYNKVIMKKKKEIKIPENNYYNIMFDVIYRQLIEFNLYQINQLHRKKTKTDFDYRLDKIKKLYHNSKKTFEIMENLKIKTLSIYGMGIIGKNLEYVLSSCGIIIEQRFDQKGPESGCFEAVVWPENGMVDSDAIIVSINDDIICEKIREKYTGRVYKIDDFLNLF